MKTRSSKTVIRALRRADLPAALALWKNSEGISLTESDNVKTLAAFLHRNPGFSSAATVEGRLVGAVLCGHDAWRGFLYHLAVSKEFRRRGIARQLVGRSLEKLRGENLLRVSIHVLAGNDKGFEFWKRAGWFGRPEITLLQFRL